MNSLSVILITRNEQANLDACLSSIREIANEIVVVDSNSSDDTLAIAKSYNAVISSPSDWPGFGAQKNRALDLATQDWVLSIDADERLSQALRDEIKAVLSNPLADCYAIPRRSYYCGRLIDYSGWNPDFVTRLFKRGTSRFSDDLIHEKLLPNGPVQKLSAPMIHYSFRTFSDVLQKIDRYSTDSAQQAFQSGKSSSVATAVFHGCWAFFRTYFLKRGFLDGGHGLALAISNAQGSYYRYLKLWLLNQKADRAH
ncbi:MAG: glycosyltransferase family 2 protein [Limnohabitans sp.]